MYGVSSVSAISQLLGVALDFVKIYQSFRDIGLVHASNQGAIGVMSQVSLTIAHTQQQ